MREETFLAVLEMIHEAALEPTAWDNVLRRLATLTGCVAGGLTVERPATRQGEPLTYFGFNPTHVERTFDHYLPMNPLFNIERRMQRGFVVTNGDVVALDVFRRSEFYNGWARPQGLCSPITVVIHRTPASYVPLTLVRPDGAGEVTAGGRALMSRLAPHLVHAMDITFRLQKADRAQQEAATLLEALPCGTILMDREQRVIFMNAAARALCDRSHAGGLSCTSGKITLRDVDADRRFQTAVSAALGLGGTPRGNRIAVNDPSGNVGLTITLAPLPPSDGIWRALGDDFVERARCLILINGTNMAELSRHYRLTAAETRMLSAIVLGKGVAAAARELGIARSTAQSHLDKIFQKTGTNRQAELVGLAKDGLKF
ncbi:helix-turn-helix transcriptional regulator [Roseomonas elaeocarpi]|uniref:Helix-turn-helix transcriptional regulator n=1 Tax=Roseomonas elaeocarpi TaxID=907779 RepID=A0ABV6JNI2_9PROT